MPFALLEYWPTSQRTSTKHAHMVQILVCDILNYNFNFLSWISRTTHFSRSIYFCHSFLKKNTKKTTLDPFFKLTRNSIIQSIFCSFEKMKLKESKADMHKWINIFLCKSIIQHWRRCHGSQWANQSSRRLFSCKSSRFMAPLLHFSNFITVQRRDFYFILT